MAKKNLDRSLSLTISLALLLVMPAAADGQDTAVAGRETVSTGDTTAVAGREAGRGAAATPQETGAEARKVSRLGVYQGYASKVYDGWVRTSRYITVRDGTRLAADIFRPAKKGKAETEPLPVIWTHHRYHRATRLGDQLLTMPTMMPALGEIIRHGYVLAAVDIRGCGASFGTWKGIFAEEETRDAYDITEWFAAQPWCNKKVGMFGRSYLGVTQYMAAATGPPHLKAIYPEMALFDLYDVLYAGGIYHHDLLDRWTAIVGHLDGTAAGLSADDLPPGSWWSAMKAVPVDGDAGEALFEAALEEHRGNRDIVEIMKPLPFRDSVDPASGKKVFRLWSPSSYVKEIRASKVAVCHFAGWFDLFTRDAFLFYHNLEGCPQRIIVGPWSHTQGAEFNQAAEQLRWFDYWLKDMDNGIMDEPPIHYYCMGASKGEAWRSAREWPLPRQKLTRFYFRQGPSGTVKSANDGVLHAKPAAADGDEGADGGFDAYAADYTATSGKPSRWSNAYGEGGVGFRYPDMTARDEKGLTYTTPPLDADVEVTGHALLRFWITASAKDADFFVRLEEVDGGGESRYVTEGALRASMRRTGSPACKFLGLPYRRFYGEDREDLPDQEPVEIVLDLWPTSNLFDKGHRIRVAIACADRDNAATPELHPPPEVRVHRDPDHPSFIVLPVLPDEQGE